MAELKKNSRVKIIDDRPLWHNKEGIVISSTIDLTDLDQYVKVKVNLGDNKNVIQTFLLRDLSLLEDNKDSTFECLNEYMHENLNTDTSKTKDVIAPYLIASDFDDQKQSWYFFDRILCAEQLEEDELISIAKKFKYPIYEIKTYSKKIKIIASKNITSDMIVDEYARFLLGFKSIKRI